MPRPEAEREGRRSKRTSLRFYYLWEKISGVRDGREKGRGGLTESGYTTLVENTIVVNIELLVRSIPINFGPPYDDDTEVPFGVVESPESRTQRRSLGSMTTDCTPMK